MKPKLTKSSVIRQKKLSNCLSMISLMLTRIIVHPHNCSSERTNFHLSTERNVCRSHIRIVAAYLSLLSMAVPSTTSAADLVGRTVGSLSCTQTGGAMYTIPIELKDGYSSFTPELALVYNSQSGNGIMGIVSQGILKSQEIFFSWIHFSVGGKKTIIMLRDLLIITLLKIIITL